MVCQADNSTAAVTRDPLGQLRPSHRDARVRMRHSRAACVQPPRLVDTAALPSKTLGSAAEEHSGSALMNSGIGTRRLVMHMPTMITVRSALNRPARDTEAPPPVEVKPELELVCEFCFEVAMVCDCPDFTTKHLVERCGKPRPV